MSRYSDFTAYDRQNLGRPVERLTARPGSTHVVTIPGTKYLAFLGDDYMLPTVGKDGLGRAPKVESLLKALARTTVGSSGRRRIKAAPMLQTLEEYSAAASDRQAA